MTGQACPLWGTPAKVVLSGSDMLRYVESPRAGGDFVCDGLMIRMLTELNPSQKVAVSDHIYEKNKLGERPKFDVSNREAITAFPTRSLPQRLDRLLLEISDHCDHLGDEVRIPILEGTIFNAAASTLNKEELSYLLETLAGKDLVALSRTQSSTDVQITPAGYATLSDLRAKGSVSRTGFVAMWFDPQMDNAYEQGFRVGIERAGFEPVIIRKKEYAGKVVDEIVAEIRRSRFVVADFTCRPPEHARGGVYFEAGFAVGIGLPVIWTCHSDSIGHVHFDTNHYNHIVWTDPGQLAEALDRRIRAIIPSAD